MLRARGWRGSRAGNWAGEGGAEIDRHPGIAARRGAAMDMGAGRSAAEPGVLDAPGGLVGRGVGVYRRGSLPLRGYRRDFGVAGEIGLVADRRGLRVGP